jgi:hypothetical protein
MSPDSINLADLAATMQRAAALRRDSTGIEQMDHEMGALIAAAEVAANRAYDAASVANDAAADAESAAYEAAEAAGAVVSLVRKWENATRVKHPWEK